MAKLASTIVQGDLLVTDFLTLKNIGSNKSTYTLYYDTNTGRVTYGPAVNTPGDIPGFSIVNPSVNEILVYGTDNLWHNTADLKWDSSIPTTAPTIGGISTGSNLYGQTMKQILYKLLYQYNSPNAAISAAPAQGTREKGMNSTKISNIVLSWSADNNPYPMSKLTRATITKNGTTINDVVLPSVDSSNGTYTDATGIQDWSATTYTISVNNVDYQPAKTSSIYYNFYYRSYCGIVVGDKTLATLTSDDIKALTYSEVRSKSNFTYTFVNVGGTAIKYVYAFPDTASAPDNYGLLSSIIDQNGFNITSAFETGYVNVNTDQGPIRYRVYIKIDPVTTSSYKMTFNT